jgi:hypothetical protein
MTQPGRLTTCGSTRAGRRLLVELEPFGKVPAWARAQIEDEAARLADFPGGELAVSRAT